MASSGLRKQDSLCVAGNPSNCPNSDKNEHEYEYQSLRCSYNYHDDDCEEIRNLGLADASYMSIFYDFDETVTYGKDMFYGRIIDNFSMLTTDSTTADTHESMWDTGTNNLENDAGVYTNLHSGQVQTEKLFYYLAILLILVTLLLMLMILIVTLDPVLRMNYFQIVTLQIAMFMIKLILIVKLFWVRMNVPG